MKSITTHAIHIAWVVILFMGQSAVKCCNVIVKVWRQVLLGFWLPDLLSREFHKLDCIGKVSVGFGVESLSFTKGSSFISEFLIHPLAE